MESRCDVDKRHAEPGQSLGRPLFLGVTESEPFPGVCGLFVHVALSARASILDTAFVQRSLLSRRLGHVLACSSAHVTEVGGLTGEMKPHA